MQDSGAIRWPTLLAAIALACLVAAAFFPLRDCEFIDFDVRAQLLDNPRVHGLSGENLKQIFTSWSLTSYYPIRALSYAVDYQIWGLNPRGFRLTNSLIHLANVLLVFWLILRLLPRRASVDASTKAWWELSAATFSAAVFAVHPVVVEPVAWVAGREELLMTLGALGCIHFHVTARRLQERGSRRRAAFACHALAAFCCAFGCLSNAVAAVIPLLITAWDVITLRRPRLWRIVSGTWALWVLGLATVVIKKLGPPNPAEPLTEAFSAGWLMLVPAIYWIYVKSLAWPSKLALTYVWSAPTSLLDVRVILGLILIGLTCLALWSVRRQKLMLFGLVWFGLALGPVCQIMPHHMPWADRFLYLPLVGLAIVVAMGLARLWSVWKGPPPVVRLTAAGLLALFLSGILVSFLVLTAVQVRTWRNSIAVWRNCLSVDRDNLVARRGLADELARTGEYDEAFSHYRTALWMKADDPKTLSSFARVLATCDDKQRRDYDLALRLAECACELSQENGSQPQSIRTQAIRHSKRTLAIVHTNYAVDLGERGEFERAVDHYRRAIETDPQYAMPLINLALLLATCPEANLRRADEAVRLAERACRMLDRPDANHLMILAIAYAQAGRAEMAAVTTKRAIRLARAAGNAQLANVLQDRLRLYQGLNRSGSADE